MSKSHILHFPGLGTDLVFQVKHYLQMVGSILLQTPIPK